MRSQPGSHRSTSERSARTSGSPTSPVCRPDLEIAPEWDACVASIARPGAQERIKTLMERGFHKPGNAEDPWVTTWVNWGASVLRNDDLDVTPCLRSRLWVSPAMPAWTRPISMRSLSQRGPGCQY